MINKYSANSRDVAKSSYYEMMTWNYFNRLKSKNKTIQNYTHLSNFNTERSIFGNLLN